MERFITINKAPTESPDPEEPKPGPSHEKLLDSDVEEHPVQKKNKKHYNESRKFNQSWTAKFVWLEKSNNSEKPFCKAAVARILENWEALILFFTEECFEDNLHSTQQILDNLKNPIYKVYLNFLVYVLEVVDKLNLEFQSENPKLHLLLRRVKDLYRTILRNFIKKSHLDTIPLESLDPGNPRYFIELNNIYLGVNVELLLSNQAVPQNDMHNFRLRVLDFYVELCKQIKSRFNFKDPYLKFIANFCPRTALSGNIGSIAILASELFPGLITDLENLNTEWRLVADLSSFEQYQDLPAQQFWLKVFETKNELNMPMFPNLSKFVKGIFSLLHSSASAERVFSQLNLLKTKTRNRLEVITCDSILQAKQHLGDQTCCTWTPSSSLLKRKGVYD
ncbi:unnamed protein product [Callosobruchus maculatus]|uniref:HAT C-terminal dimerisation domain-containing protein n=1 Tax=Callosobruchus maculatus TaxID=64391 RepID=A0A653BP85_CALMS|nr:unnamed protein product [Callosobruchus maculatus]